MVEEDRGRLHATDYGGRPPLIHAAREGHLAVVTYLLDQGSRINHQARSFNDTALYLACCKGHSEVVQVLLERGADPTLRDLHGWTPLITASCHGRLEVVVCLLRHGGSSLDAVNNEGSTALSWASYQGRSGLVRLLLQAGADFTIPNSQGHTPLYRARQSDCQACVALLEVRMQG